MVGASANTVFVDLTMKQNNSSVFINLFQKRYFELNKDDTKQTIDQNAENVEVFNVKITHRMLKAQEFKVSYNIILLRTLGAVQT